MYRFLLSIFSPFMLVWVLKEARQQKNWLWLRQRLGLITPTSVDIWVHCASVGEVNAAAPLIQACLAKQKRIHISCFTPTGIEQVKRRFVDTAHLSYSALPLDWGWTVHNFLHRLHCQQLWLVETELWPTLIEQAHQRGIEINIINGRLSKKTLNTPHWWRRLLASLIEYKTHRCILRNEKDKLDFMHLGVSESKLSIGGNLKYCDPIMPNEDPLISVPYILLASSHHPEEITLAQLWQQYPELPKLVIVPRHPKRRDSLRQQFLITNIPFQLRSETDEVLPNGILISDTFGELKTWISHASLVIIGGSFVDKGGQNPLEAAKLGKMILSGQDMSDFIEETALLSKLGLLTQYPDMPTLMLDINNQITRTTSVHHHDQLLTLENEILRYYVDALCH